MPSKEHVKQVIPEPDPRPGQRLGRHLHHDPQSLQYPMRDLLDLAAPLQTKRWMRRIGPLDQGQLGSCTGNACLGMLATEPLHKTAGWRNIHYKEAVAVELYSLATVLDEFQGQYPPEDTGSSGLGACKAAQAKTWIDNYVWGFTLDDTLRWISQKSPVIVGTIWTQDMFTPDRAGFLHPTGSVAGGHEYELVGLNVEHGYVEMENSWSRGWGISGRAKIAIADLEVLLINNQGDAKAGIRNAA